MARVYLECQTAAFGRGSQIDPPMGQLSAKVIKEWLRTVPGNYASEDRSQQIQRVIDDTERPDHSGRRDPVIHLFVAISSPMETRLSLLEHDLRESVCYRSFYARTWALYLIWITQSGAAYGVNLDNESGQYRLGWEDPEEYQRRWTPQGQGKARLWTLLSPNSLFTVPNDLDQIRATFRSPYQLRGDLRSGSAIFHKTSQILSEHLIASVIEIRARILAREQIAQESLHAITSVEITITPPEHATRPCAAVVRIVGNPEQPQVCVCAHELMRLEDAFAIRDAANPSGTTLRFVFDDAELQFRASPRLARQLARLRIWSDHLLKRVFYLEEGTGNLPIAIV